MADKLPQWHTDLLELYTQGGSDVEAAVILKITLRRFEQLYLEQPAFAEIIDMCRTLSRAWWDSLPRKNLWNKDFNAPLYGFNMKNRFGWADKTEVREEKSARDMDLAELRARIVKQMPHLLKRMPELANHLALVETSKGETE